MLVEWKNVTPGYNFDVHWIASRDYITREGYAWVGVSAQRVGVAIERSSRHSTQAANAGHNTRTILPTDGTPVSVIRNRR